MPNQDCRRLLVMLDETSSYKPYNHRQPFETRVMSFSNWCLGIGIVQFAIAAVLGFGHRFNMLKLDWGLNLILVLSLASMLFSLLSICAPIVLFAWYAKNWKKLTFKDLENSFEHDWEIIQGVKMFPSKILSFVKLWLETKVTRFERRLGLVFGSKTAAFSLLILSLGFVDRLGGFGVFVDVIGSRVTRSNYIQWGAVVFLAVILGLSLGALIMKRLASRYSYQAELIGLALEAKDINKANFV
ncbi:hypothetical protein [Salinicola halimionae]|uniref:hypothetical protein n=1 Tax=Salinicola halimionae TaxID=1949081 RepID=UPI00130057FB|nr:hypothetical protein [Salinicola halimionae]